MRVILGAMLEASIILAFILGVYGAVMMVRNLIWRISHLRHRRKADARIIAQAKGAGVWDKQPIVLGGRALELKAWQDFKIKREPGEPDARLRRRYMAKREESAQIPLPLEILCGGGQSKQSSKGEDAE